MTTDYKALKAGGFMRQVQKDRFSLRIKVVGGNLTTGQLRTIAEVADRHGVGHVHLTSRQGLEIPFIELKDIETVKESLAAGSVDTGICGPRVRTVTACQGSEVCPHGCVDTLALAKAISDRYFGRELPHKFKFGITGCQNNCLKAEENDLGIKGGYVIEWQEQPCVYCGICAKVCREGAIFASDDEIRLDPSKCNHCGRCVKSCPSDAWKGQSGYILSFGGLFGNRIYTGKHIIGIQTDLETVFRAADAALDFFKLHGNPGERFLAAIERTGWEELKNAVQAAVLAPSPAPSQAGAAA
ncbi:MAG: 4Fe-4S binding protein [Deltaproteobacteria bacterium]|jgi:dissimilatory sulfite reductase (desulfoviridin) alpha/beta subunit|nr:4Fe-4S binding protein [Deltaproteobacteria bacterium]